MEPTWGPMGEGMRVPDLNLLTRGFFAEGMDDAFVRFAFRNRTASKRATRGSVLNRMERAGRFYQRADENGDLFPEPKEPKLIRRPLRALPEGQVIDLRWASAYEPLHHLHSETLLRVDRNQTCHARWLRHDEPAPVAICLHGWGAGWLPVEERNFSAEYLYKQGLDVVLFVQPFHGRRSPLLRQTPMFPTVDPIRTNEGFAQAVWDVRSLIRALRSRGASHVGLIGMSLGGHTSALTGTVSQDLDFLMPLISFGSIPDLLWGHLADTRVGDMASGRGLTPELLAYALQATTPLMRSPQVDPSKVLVIAGERDRVAPLRHSNRLRDHFQGAKMITFPGAHVLQVGRGQAYREAVAFLRDLRVLPPVR